MLGPVNQDHPGPPVAGVSASAWSKAAAITSAGSFPPDPDSHLALAGYFAGFTGTAPAAGRGDHVVRAALPARRRRRRRAWPSACGRFLPGRQPGPHLPQPGGSPGSGLPRASGRITIPLESADKPPASRTCTAREPARRRTRGYRRRRAPRHPRPASCPSPARTAGDRGVRGPEGAARRLDDGQPGQGMGMPPAGSDGRRRPGRNSPSRGCATRTGRPDRAEQRGQQPAVPGLQPGPGDPVGARRGGAAGRACCSSRAARGPGGPAEAAAAAPVPARPRVPRAGRPSSPLSRGGQTRRPAR